jgi:serine/threonine-protein kinase RsbT
MNTETKIYVNNDLDIVIARMQARNVAKRMGFNTADQARISLVASELARVLSWTKGETTEMVISPARKNGCQGLQVSCIIQRKYIPTEPEPKEVVSSNSFTGACRLVDESNIELENDHQARVTLVKWLK